MAGVDTPGACDQPLEVDPDSQIPFEEALDSPEEVASGVRGIYDAMQADGGYNRNLLVYPDLYADNLAFTGTFDTDAEVSASMRTVAHDRDRYAVVWALAEALLQHDELAANWRARHVVMVERMIGAKSGTGGSTGAAYLRSRLPLQYYPLLWELRSQL